MRISKIGNICVRKGLENEWVMVSQEHLNECIEYINQHNITYLEIGGAYEDEDVNFLEHCSNVEHLIISNHAIKNISGVYDLKKLKSLSITESSLTLELDKLTTLEKLFLHWNKRITGIEHLVNLKQLYLWNYAPKGGNLEELRDLTKIEVLSLTQCKIHSLAGIGNLKKLRRLELNYLRQLNDLADLRGVKNSLQRLEIESCKKVEDPSEIQYLQKLEFLIFSNCGDIPSIGFIRELPHLKHFAFDGTNVLDGDLSVCTRLDSVYFTNKKHYSHKLKDLEKNKVISQAPQNTMGDITTYEELKRNKPTTDWRQRMKEGDDLFTDANIHAVDDILDSYIHSLSALGNTLSKAEIMECVKKVVLKLNELNEEFDYFIETMEREELYDFIDEAARMAGLESEEDITEEWREW